MMNYVRVSVTEPGGWLVLYADYYGPSAQLLLGACWTLIPVNARSRGRLGLRLGLLYSRKAAALAGAERGARGVGSQRQGRACSAALAKSPEGDPRTHDRARLGLRLGKQALLHIHLSYGASGSRCALGSYNTLDPCI